MHPEGGIMSHPFISIRVRYLWVALLMWSLPLVFAETRYIAHWGRDSNSGSISAPWATISHAASQAQPGDTIFVRGGTYSEGEIWIRQDQGMGGKNRRYVTIAAFPKETPRFTNGSRGLIVDASYVRVIGLRFENGKTLYNVDWAGSTHHIEFIRNHFSGTPDYAAISITGDSNLVAENVIDISGNSVGTQGHGIYASKGVHTIIRGNFIAGATGYGIHLYEERRSGDPSGYMREIRDVVIENNYVSNSQKRSGIIVAAGADSGPAFIDGVVIRHNMVVNNAQYGIVLNGWSAIRNIDLYHNTIYGNADNGIQIEQEVKNVRIKNNLICVRSGLYHIDNASNAQGVVVDHNLYDPAPVKVNEVTELFPITGDPRFVDVGNGDFHLREGSAAIDAGVDLGVPFSGAAPDLGAFEFGQFTSVGSDRRDKTGAFDLKQNYPNPFNPETEIRFSLPIDGTMDLSIFNLQGQHIRTLARGQQTAGLKKVIWDGLDDKGNKVRSGIYLYHLQVKGYSLTRKMAFLQ